MMVLQTSNSLRLHTPTMIKKEARIFLKDARGFGKLLKSEGTAGKQGEGITEKADKAAVSLVTKYCIDPKTYWRQAGDDRNSDFVEVLVAARLNNKKNSDLIYIVEHTGLENLIMDFTRKNYAAALGAFEKALERVNGN